MSVVPSLYARPICGYDLRASHARELQPAALASVSNGSVLVEFVIPVVLYMEELAHNDQSGLFERG